MSNFKKATEVRQNRATERAKEAAEVFKRVGFIDETSAIMCVSRFTIYDWFKKIGFDHKPYKKSRAEAVIKVPKIYRSDVNERDPITNGRIMADKRNNKRFNKQWMELTSAPSFVSQALREYANG